MLNVIVELDFKVIYVRFAMLVYQIQYINFYCYK